MVSTKVGEQLEIKSTKSDRFDVVDFDVIIEPSNSCKMEVIGYVAGYNPATEKHEDILIEKPSNDRPVKIESLLEMVTWFMIHKEWFIEKILMEEHSK